MTIDNEQTETSKEQNKDAVVQPDPKTLNTPDPQDKMEGPISSLIQGVKHKAKGNETKEEADKKKEERM